VVCTHNHSMSSSELNGNQSPTPPTTSRKKRKSVRSNSGYNVNNGQQPSTSAASSAESYSHIHAHLAGTPNSSASTSSLQEFVANAVNSVAQTLGSAFGAASSLAAASSSTGLQGNGDKPRKARAKQQPDPNDTIDLTKDDEDSNDIVDITDDEVIVLKANVPRRPGDKKPGPLCRTRGTELESIGCKCCKNRHVPYAEVVVQSANNHEGGSLGSPSGKKGKRGVSPASASTPAPPPQSQSKGYKCPICLEVIEPNSQKKMASTNCGHIFCFDCIKDAIKVSKQCPKCRKKLTVKGYHQIFISFD